MTNCIHESKFVADTMALVLRIEHRRMSLIGRKIFDSVESNNAIVYIPAIVFAEILYLSEKQRIGISLMDVKEYLQRYPNCKEYPMNFDVIKSTSSIIDIPELHDRLIAGTAHLLNLPLVTNDPNIQVSKYVKTIW